ncbi:hypothetical protein ABZV14_12665 [Streptosporangium canum]|uniref:hypothetical protein n=1 Tax=Streptosporangium canum TaxID=324952 RepID=UPI0033B1AA72
MSGGLEIDRIWVGTHAPHQMNVHSEDYATAVHRLREREIGGASWGEVGLIAECAAALGLSGHYLQEVLDDLGPAINRTGDDLHTAAAGISEVEAVFQDDARNMLGQASA